MPKKSILSFIILVLLMAGCGEEIINDSSATILTEESSSKMHELSYGLQSQDELSNQVSLRPDDIVLLKYTAGGLRPPQFDGWGIKTTVFFDGRVVKSERDNAASPWKETLIITLTPDEISDLMAAVSNLQSGELTFPKEEGCTCVPSTSYSGRNNEGELVQFANSSNCLLGILESFSAAEKLILKLDSF